MDATNQSPDRRSQRIVVTAEQRRRDKDAELARSVRQDQVGLERRRQELAFTQERERAKEQKKEKRKAARKKARADLWAKLNGAAPVVGRRVMIVGPILAPMAVAWIGQIGFAQTTLGWNLLGALVFAASWELTTAFTGWMYHQARQDGDQGTIFRIATWIFASAAGFMNYWHAAIDDAKNPAGKDVKDAAGKATKSGLDAILDPTPKAVAFGVMSLVGIALWELYSSLVHRKHLRDKNLLPAPRPRFGVARWVRYPNITWTAWSLTIRYGIKTTADAWTAAVADRARKSSAKTGRSPIHVTVVHSLRTRLSTAPLRTWTQPAVIWTPSMRAIAASGHPAALPQVTAEVMPQVTDPATVRVTGRSLAQATPEPLTQATPDGVTQGTAQVTDPVATQVTPEVTPQGMAQATPQVTPESVTQDMTQGATQVTEEVTQQGTRKSPRGRSTKSRDKSRRTDAELIAELDGIVAEHYRDHPGEEINVKPVATRLGIGRDRARRLLDQMNVRPIRKAN